VQAAAADLHKPIQLIDFWETDNPASPSLRAIALALFLDLRQVGDQRQAIAALENAIDSDKSNPDLHFWYAVALAKRGQWHAAVPHYEIASRKRDSALTWFSLGEAKRHSGRLKEAMAILRQAIERFPDFLDSYSELAETYAALGDLPMALETLDRSLDRFPHQGAVQVRRAQLAYLAGHNAERVLSRVAEARRLQPDSVILWWIEGQCLADQQRTPDAIVAFESALAVDERYEPALLALGPLLVRAGRFDDARKRLDQLARIAPQHPVLARARMELERAIQSNK
jgi:tetratricopeptide (TPR) repeat protein